MTVANSLDTILICAYRMASWIYSKLVLWFCGYRIETKIKWPPFCRRHFQIHLHEEQNLNFDSNFIKVCSWASNKHWAIIGSENFSESNKRQAIIWNNDGIAYKQIYDPSLSLDEFNYSSWMLWFWSYNIVVIHLPIYPSQLHRHCDIPLNDPTLV